MNSTNRALQERILLTLLVSLWQSPGLVFAEGYHNSSKRFTGPEAMSESDWSDPAEMQRTWNAALVRIPGGRDGVVKSPMHALDGAQTPKGKRYPTVIYLHGCSGVWAGTYRRIDFLAHSGFAVIAPVSFARQKYPQSCNTGKHQGGMYRPTLKMRQFDAGHAIKAAKRLSWVDPNNVFLMGLSQGGITAATFKSNDPEAAVNARVVEGWTCHAGWEEYRGIHAPADEPVLTLVGEKDPWFQRPRSRGDCGEFLNKTNGSESIVFSSGHLRNRHELLEDQGVQQTVLRFLRKQTRDPADQAVE